MPAKKALKNTSKKSSKQVKAPAKAPNGLRLRPLSRRQRKIRDKNNQKLKSLPKARQILAAAIKNLWDNKRFFGGILLVYGLLYILLVKGISANFQLGNLKQNLNDAFGGQLGTLNTGLALYGLLLGSAGSGVDATAGTYQTFLLITVSLALIWALRQTHTAKSAKIKARDSYYKGMYPLVQFILVLFVIFLQLLPALIFSSLYSVGQNSGTFVGGLQQIISVGVLIGAVLLSLYWLSSSIFALYIVTLPDARPMASLRAAKKLVRFRRSLIIRKVVFLPIVMLLFSALVLVPLIIFLPVAAELLFVVFSVGSLALVHAYFYNLYRSLL